MDLKNPITRWALAIGAGETITVLWRSNRTPRTASGITMKRARCGGRP
jgi:hypothetical protein